MEYQRLGNTGLIVSRMALGVMTFGTPAGPNADESLRRLGTDYVDLYLVHRMDPYTPIGETLEALNDLVRMGKVRYIGFSNWNAWSAAKAAGIQNQNGWTRFSAAEMYYSLLGRDIEHEIVPFDQEKGYDVVERLRALAATRDASPTQLALVWMLTKAICLIDPSWSKQDRTTRRQSRRTQGEVVGSGSRGTRCAHRSAIAVPEMVRGTFRGSDSEASARFGRLKATNHESVDRESGDPCCHCRDDWHPRAARKAKPINQDRKE
jgi:aryl-alcohol dehydrogenase-like predicted oxidoreductase